MPNPPLDAAPQIAALASACAQQLASSPSTFGNAGEFAATFKALLAAIASSDPRYGFDREGRPDAVRAVRGALPAMEAELFDAIIDDVACELAAVQEALYQVALSATSRGARAEAP